MEQKWAEERRCQLEMERKLEEERKLREEQSAMMQSMVTWMQGFGALLNYADWANWALLRNRFNKQILTSFGRRIRWK